MVKRAPAVYVSHHSDIWQGGSGLEGRSGRASMSVFIITSRRHSVSGIRDRTSSVGVIDGAGQTLAMRMD